MEMRPWKIAVPKRSDAAGPETLPLFFRALLKARGLREASAVRALPEGEGRLHDPFLLPDMAKAVQRVKEAVGNRERILVYGDYDCDGVTATVLLYDYLDNAGADVLYYIPEREAEGYGLNTAAVDRMREAGVDLIITVDNGVTAAAEIAYAAKNGIEVVVTDHHRPGTELPEAVAVVDPHRADSRYPFPDLCGVGVAFKLVCALEEDSEGMLLEHYGELVALGTVADVVPLLDENRTLVKAGLSLMGESLSPGLLALAEKAGVDLTTIRAEEIAFALAPRINVAGRIGSVDQAVELLLCREEERAAELAEAICALNDRRKALESEIIGEIRLMLEQRPELLDRRVPALVGSGWNPGVIGIIAARLAERYEKPFVLLSVSGGEARGSARSVEGFSIIEAIRSCAPLLTKHGGHPMAAGLSLDEENIPDFCRELENYAREHHPVMPMPTLSVDTVVKADEITLDNIRLLERLEPFGCGNPPPVFALLGARVERIAAMGNGNHLRLTLSQDGAGLTAVLFGVGPQEFPLEPGELADCAVALSVNRYRGTEQPQVRLLSIRPHGFDMEGKKRLKAAYQAIRRGEEPTGEAGNELAFDREDLSAVFLFLRKNSPWVKGTDMLAHRLRATVNYGKVLAALDVLSELGLVSRGKEQGREVIRLLPNSGKMVLSDSHTYRVLQQRLVNVN